MEVVPEDRPVVVVAEVGAQAPLRARVPLGQGAHCPFW